MKRLGIDIGGTFTDLLVLDEETGHLVARCKVASTPKDPSDAIAAGIVEIVRQASGSDFSFVCHGTTVITNALLQHQTSPTGMITTGGFRDVLEIARMVRSNVYDLNFERLPPLVPRDRIEELSERMLSDGTPLRPVAIEEVDSAVARLLAKGVESVAVCLLNSYVNPEHERAVASRIASIAPNLLTCISSELVPEFREYERMASTVVNSSFVPLFRGYVDKISRRLSSLGINAPLYLMLSSGGIMNGEFSKDRPIAFIESGPAAGVIAAAKYGNLAGFEDVLSLDMGGTTAKASLIEGGVPSVTLDYSVGGLRHGRSLGAFTAGYPIKVPVIDLVEVGTGGGSVAWADEVGGLHVGPRSAGADPGPMSYGRGGEEPTVTDAHVVTGVINPANFLGGNMPLDPDLAFRGIERLGRRLGLDAETTAQGIIEIADAAMIGALRMASVERGIDPRGLALVGFGGAGPMRAASLGQTMGMAAVVIPPHPGLFSALGLLVSDIQIDHTRSLIRRLDAHGIAHLDAALEELAEVSKRELDQQGVPAESQHLARFVDLRYLGQSYELTIQLSPAGKGSRLEREATRKFHKAHQRRFGYSKSDLPIQIVGVRVSAVGSLPSLRLDPSVEGDGAAERARSGARRVQVARGITTAVDIYDRAALVPGDTINGPAIFEQFDSTVLVPPGHSVSVDRYLNLVIRRANAS
jgi:N-methylhydantoinase A